MVFSLFMCLSDDCNGAKFKGLRLLAPVCPVYHTDCGPQGRGMCTFRVQALVQAFKAPRG